MIMSTMAKKDITRTIVENTVRLNMRYYDADPKRTIRRMIDTGRRLSYGCIQSEMMQRISTLFSKERSAYYKAVDTLMQTVDREKLLQFGLSLGVSSWTKGSHRIHLVNQVTGREYSWLIRIPVDASAGSMLTTSTCDRVFDYLGKSGVHSFSFQCHEDGIPYLPAILQAVRNHPGNAYYIELPDKELNEALLNSLEPVKNVLWGIPAEGHHSQELQEAFQKRRYFYCFVRNVPADVMSADPGRIQDALNEYTCAIPQGASPVLLLKEDVSTLSSMPASYLHEIDVYRMSCRHPYLLISYFSDVQKINRILIGEDLSLSLSDYLPQRVVTT